MKQHTKWLAIGLAVAGLGITNSSQAQYLLGNGASSGITMAGGSFAGAPTTTANGLTLTEPTNPGYNWGEWDIPVGQQQVFNAGDNKIIFNYTILSPAPGTTGADYTGGNAWTWYGLQPLVNTAGAGLVRYFGYDGYNLTYSPINGQNIANQDPGYVYNAANQTVTETGSLSAAQATDIASGDPITFFQISADLSGTLPDGYSLQINSIELVPEPCTVALVGLGLAGLVIARRRATVS
jgi:hypothetical protein